NIRSLSATLLAIHIVLPQAVNGEEFTAQANSDAPQAEAGAEAATDTSLLATLQKLNGLFRADDYDTAYQLASDTAADYEGDESFDFFYGFSAMQSGHADQAVFIFERLSNNYPYNPRYQTELARCYYALGNYAEAERLFLQIKELNPPENVARSVDKFLDAIEEKRRQQQSIASALITLAGGYDSNINSATDLEEVEVLDFVQPVLLNRDSREQDSGYLQLRGVASYSAPMTRRSRWNIGAGVSRKDNTDSNAFDLDTANLNAGLQWLRGTHTLGLSANFSHYWFGGDSLLNDGGLRFSWKNQRASGLRYTSDISYNLQRNRVDQELDLNRLQWQAGIGYSQPRWSTALTLLLATDDPQTDYRGRDTAGLSLQGIYRAGAATSIYSQLQYRAYRYQEALPTTNILAAGETRDDDLVQFLAGARHALHKQVSLYIQANVMDYSSNIDLYSYDRYLAEAGVNLTF
ncbi:MAG: hypothetical protein CMI13_11395, partial [Oleibacter sp.]|nr:hypothetical protein [Thalassolituus sp.]